MTRCEILMKLKTMVRPPAISDFLASALRMVMRITSSSPKEAVVATVGAFLVGALGNAIRSTTRVAPTSINRSQRHRS